MTAEGPWTEATVRDTLIVAVALGKVPEDVLALLRENDPDVIPAGLALREAAVREYLTPEEDPR